MKQFIAAFIAICAIAFALSGKAENILAGGAILIPAGNTNAATQRIVLDSYRGMQWANVRRVIIRNDSPAGTSTNGTYSVKCNDLDVGTVIATGTNAAGTVSSHIVDASAQPSRIVDITVQPDEGGSGTTDQVWRYFIFAE